MQNNASAAINNLRRLGARRHEAREETKRIEERLAALFEHQDFSVLRNYKPERAPGYDPGEVDLICARDGYLFVLEIKSTFYEAHRKKPGYMAPRRFVRPDCNSVARYMPLNNHLILMRAWRKHSAWIPECARSMFMAGS